MRRKRFELRLTDEERATLEAGAAHYQTTVTGLIRKAIKAVLSQQPVLAPAEFDELYRARELFRQAGNNLNSLLRQVYLTQAEVTVRGPEPEEFHAMLAELRRSTAHYTQMLAKFP
jgi:hypothetical protein